MAIDPISALSPSPSASQLSALSAVDDRTRTAPPAQVDDAVPASSYDPRAFVTGPAAIVIQSEAAIATLSVASLALYARYGSPLATPDGVSPVSAISATTRVLRVGDEVRRG